MGRGRVLIAIAIACMGAWGCAKGVGDLQGSLFGGAGVGDETGDGDDDDDGESGSEGGPGESTTGADGETGHETGAGGFPPDTSGAPQSTSGSPPPTTGLPDPGDSTGGLPEVGSTSAPFGGTGFGTGGSGELGDPCTQNADCESNICVNAGFAIYCSEQCQSEQDCPPGWLCVATTTPGLNVCY
jgi:hypothetical protein